MEPCPGQVNTEVSISSQFREANLTESQSLWLSLQALFVYKVEDIIEPDELSHELKVPLALSCLRFD